MKDLMRVDSSGRDSVPSMEWIRSEIEGYLADWRQRRGQDYWRGPRVGIAAADDPLFSQLGRAVDPSHAMPRDLLKGALFETRFDRQACYRQCLANDAHYSDLPLVDVCGKCASQVPCSHEIPEIGDSH
jgi:hypothetical protein